MNDLIVLSNAQTMSSLEIATLTGKDHSDVLKDVRRILAEAEIGEGKLSGSYLSEQNKELPCFNLPRMECDLIISGYSVKYRLAIIKRWHELEAGKIPVTYIAALEALLASEKIKEAALIEVAKLNTLCDNEFGYCSIIRASIFLGIHEKELNWRPLKDATIRLGLKVRKVPSPRYGYMNLYALRAFKEVYPEHDFDDLTPELVEDKAKLTLVTPLVHRA